MSDEALLFIEHATACGAHPFVPSSRYVIGERLQELPPCNQFSPDREANPSVVGDGVGAGPDGADAPSGGSVVKKLGRMPDGGGHSTLGRRAGRATRGGMGFGEASEAAAAINASINCWKAPCPTQMRKRS